MTEVNLLMTKKVITISQDMPIVDAVVKLSKLGFNGLPVLNAEGKLVGLFSERSLLTDSAYVHLRTLIKLFSEMEYYKKDNSFIKNQLKDIVQLKIKDLMNPKPVTIRPTDDMEDIRQLFADGVNNPLIVINEQNQVVGILAMSDLTKFYEVPLNKSLTEADVDRQIDHFVEGFEKQFIIVSKFRAKTWLVSGLVLMAAGFIIAILFIIRIVQK